MASSTSGSPDRASVDVLVVGAGPAGSATAALLARAGYAVAAVDRAAFPRDKACSEYMGPETVRILARLGVLDALEAAGAAALEGTAVTARAGLAACAASSRSRDTIPFARPAFRSRG